MMTAMPGAPIAAAEAVRADTTAAVDARHRGAAALPDLRQRVLDVGENPLEERSHAGGDRRVPGLPAQGTQSPLLATATERARRGRPVGRGRGCRSSKER